jgi:hypothetical protein
VVVSSTEGLGRWISLGFLGRELGLIDWGIRILGDISLGLLPWSRTAFGLVGTSNASTGEQHSLDTFLDLW